MTPAQNREADWGSGILLYIQGSILLLAVVLAVILTAVRLLKGKVSGDTTHKAAKEILFNSLVFTVAVISTIDNVYFIFAMAFRNR